ncbi:AI-2E family transporter [Paeniglutamicibacter cryotolerans]|uniref:Putative PurR-regulated permease PerM n=1 Tax=Paeniglutamicibacter cryotolerans TaxID=670079 RepID=A0A839QM16_9MICC|nr:AI-2E family transporter [Paeniglutamicibacter cryotolerans]MBB2996897.1 putative PurR-regulated permease PerM [Paeniglutamicibacter cryotolerans]
MKPGFRGAFFATLGVLLALALGAAVASLTYALTLVFIAFFISLVLDPLVSWFETTGMSRGKAVATVLIGFLVLILGIRALVIPLLVTEGLSLLRSLPSLLDGISHQEWFISLDMRFNGALEPGIEWPERTIADPATWVVVGNGALHVGIGVANAVFGVVFVAILTIYFVSSLKTIKSAFYDLVPASKRPGVEEISEEIAASVGGYLSGMAILASINASFPFILFTIMHVPYAPVHAILALPITMIPLVGSVISASIMTVVSFFDSPGTALIVLLVMLVYMQVEAYLLTPRIVGKAIKIPASLVLIGAMIGGTLAGLLGAMVACPVTASILLIMNKVVIPAQAKR